MRALQANNNADEIPERNAGMAIRAVVFDIGGVLEITPQTGIAKPDRRIYELTCERLGVQPAEMIFLDDHQRPVAGARALGIHALLFQNTAQAIADIQACLQAT